ncbi:hypothetical protein MUK42_02846 [Musa troglodytarum]|uniref:Transcription repressor n=1 Tax=Musa troglodytarum TaxID=320322 RepID=A0A9E7JHN5_9LILI|nr:hypothetical protein MUK42_02846 [Musa troglodytarum]
MKAVGERRERAKRCSSNSLSFLASLPRDIRGAIAESICAVKYSVDRLTDFKESTVEVNRDGGVRDRKEMEALVYCFVVLNSSDVHCFIAEAFLGASSPRLQLPVRNDLMLV